jgi:hypothetical protein
LVKGTGRRIRELGMETGRWELETGKRNRKMKFGFGNGNRKKGVRYSGQVLQSKNMTIFVIIISGIVINEVAFNGLITKKYYLKIN